MLSALFKPPTHPHAGARAISVRKGETVRTKDARDMDLYVGRIARHSEFHIHVQLLQ
jgi:hypothetical protein